MAAEAEADDGWTVVKRQKVLPLHCLPPPPPPSAPCPQPTHSRCARPHPACLCGRPAIMKRTACMERYGEGAEKPALSASLKMGQGQQLRQLYIGLELNPD